MKKLNITKKQYGESKYFNKKYGSLKFVSESGKLFKTDKGVILALESDDEIEAPEETPEVVAPKVEDDAEVTRGELTEMLKDVVATVEKVCDDQDVSYAEVVGAEPEEEDEDLDADEVVATKEEVAEVLVAVLDEVKKVADENGIELPEPEDEKEEEKEEEKADDEEKKDDDEEVEGECTCKKECKGAACECGDTNKPTMESRKAKAKMVREAIAKRRRARLLKEAIARRARARKVLESRKASKNVACKAK